LKLLFRNRNILIARATNATALQQAQRCKGHDMRLSPSLWTTVAAALLALPITAAAAKPHQHGVATLDIAHDGRTLSITLETPQDNLLGHERAPRNDAERQAADAAVTALKAGQTLFRIDPAARCTLATVALNSATLKLGTPAAGKPGDEHADLDASYRFDCAGPVPAFVDVALFDAFKRMSRIDVQVATAQGQARVVLKRPTQRVTLPR
jgi:hypothetical protein